MEIRNTRPIKTKPIGELVKTIIIIPSKKEVKEFFDQVKVDDLSFEEIIFEWNENHDTIILDILPYTNQFQVEEEMPFVYTYNKDNEAMHFIFLEIQEKILPNQLKNVEELSGEGQLITPFMLKFADYNQKYLINPELNFFNLPKNGIILNGIRLVLDSQKPKLTGRAAELAKKKERIYEKRNNRL